MSFVIRFASHKKTVPWTKLVTVKHGEKEKQNVFSIQHNSLQWINIYKNFFSHYKCLQISIIVVVIITIILASASRKPQAKNYSYGYYYYCYYYYYHHHYHHHYFIIRTIIICFRQSVNTVWEIQTKNQTKRKIFRSRCNIQSVQSAAANCRTTQQNWQLKVLKYYSITCYYYPRGLCRRGYDFRVRLFVCCPQHNSETNNKVFKLGIGNDLGIP